VQVHPGIRTQTNDVAGVRRNLGLIENDVEHCLKK
jgi:hypothetical protein